MAERPILFSAPSVRAILDGKKTQTRRLVKPQPEWRVVANAFCSWAFRQRCGSGWWLWPNAASVVLGECPYGQPGDLLWVREATTRSGGMVQYVADGYTSRCHGWPPHWTRDPQQGRFLPKRFARLWLEVVEVRVERLQEISGEGAIREGVDPTPHRCGCDPCSATSALCPATASSLSLAFAELWNQLHGADAWERNPWVWVVTFRRTEAPRREAA